MAIQVWKNVYKIRGGYRQQPREGHDTIRMAIHGLQYNTYTGFLGLYFQKFELFFNIVSYPGPHVQLF